MGIVSALDKTLSKAAKEAGKSVTKKKPITAKEAAEKVKATTMKKAAAKKKAAKKKKKPTKPKNVRVSKKKQLTKRKTTALTTRKKPGLPAKTTPASKKQIAKRGKTGMIPYSQAKAAQARRKAKQSKTGRRVAEAAVVGTGAVVGYSAMREKQRRDAAETSKRSYGKKSSTAATTAAATPKPKAKAKSTRTSKPTKRKAAKGFGIDLYTAADKLRAKRKRNKKK